MYYQGEAYQRKKIFIFHLVCLQQKMTFIENYTKLVNLKFSKNTSGTSIMSKEAMVAKLLPPNNMSITEFTNYKTETEESKDTEKDGKKTINRLLVL